MVAKILLAFPMPPPFTIDVFYKTFEQNNPSFLSRCIQANESTPSGWMTSLVVHIDTLPCLRNGNWYASVY